MQFRSGRAFWLGILFAGFLVLAVATVGAAAPEAVPGQLLVKIRNVAGAGGARMQNAAGRGVALPLPAGARVVKPLALPGWHLVELPPDLGTRAGVAWFRGRPEVAFVEPNLRYHLHRTPTDPDWPWLHGLAEIGAPAAWNTTTGSSNIVVAVIDTGIDTTHPDLVPNLWRNPAEISGNGIDDDNNGVVDDVFGADFADNDGDPSDDAGHGTHVAGTIGALANNGRGVAGVCWKVWIMAVRVLRADGSADTPGFLAAFDYVVKMKQRGVDVRAINCSWGGGGASAALKEAIQAAGSAGILIVCSAGNDRQNNDLLPAFPAGYDCPEILAVAASTACDELANFSNYGRATVHLGAPGRDILSTFRGGERYAVLSGTSMASPHVTGAAALLASFRPDLTVAQLRDLILATVDPLPAWSGIVSSGGRLNVARAMEQLASGRPPVSPASPAVPGRITGVSRLASGRWGDNDSSEPVISADGRWVAFTSAATNLVAADSGGVVQILLSDRRSNTLVRVSQTAAGVGANGDCSGPSISADGRYVAFMSMASNLVSSDANGANDVFVWDRDTGQIELVSVRTDGQASGNGPSESPAISGDGKVVAFMSTARDLIGSDRSAQTDVFVRDRARKVTERVSVSSGGVEANGPSEAPSISADGRQVAFHSLASNLVSGDRNASWDVFVRDRTTGLTELASLQGAATQGDSDSVFPILSADGRFVLFHSAAANFDAQGGDFLGVFLRDRQEKSLVRANARPGTVAAGDAFVDGLSADGRYATFTTDDPALGPGGAPELYRAWVFDRLTGGIGEIGVNDGGYDVDNNTFFGRPSADGRYVAFASYAATPMPGHGTGVGSIFVEDRGPARPDLSVRVAGAAGGYAGFGPINPAAPQRAGTNVARGGSATYEVQVSNGGGAQAFVLRLQWTGVGPHPGWSVGATDVVGGVDLTPAMIGEGWTTPVLDAGSNLVVRVRVGREASDAGQAVFGARITAAAAGGGGVVDAVSAVTETTSLAPGFVLASRSFDGVPAGRNAEVTDVSGDGRYVVFSSETDHLEPREDINEESDVFRFDRDAGTVVRLSDASPTRQGDADSRYPSMSADGRRVAFQSRASNLVPFDTNDAEDIFVKDLETGAMTRASVSADGKQGNRGSETALLSADGRFVAFTSLATNLVAGDTNNAHDVFLRNLETGAVECVSRSTAGAIGNADSEAAAVSGDGRFVLFSSYADNLGPADANGRADAYLLDRVAGVLELVSRNTNGVAANGASRPLSVSDDGRWVSFQSFATDLTPGGATPERWGYVLDRQNNRVLTLPQAVGSSPVTLDSRGAIVSPDGNSWAVAGHTPCGTAPGVDQIWVKDTRQGTVRLLSAEQAESSSLPGDDHSFIGKFSADGRFLTFESYAVNLLGEVARGAGQVFLADLATPLPAALSRRGPDGPWRGSTEFSTTAPELKSISLTASGGVEATREFGLQVVNRGSAPDRFLLTAAKPAVAVGAVRVIVAGTPPSDVTDAIFAGGWTTPLLQPREGVDLTIGTTLAERPVADLVLDLKAGSLTNPFRSDGVRLLTLADQDADGMPDGWELSLFGSLTKAGPGTDSDGDGASDVDEWLAGTNPLDPGEVVRLTIGALPGGNAVSLDWPSKPDRYYQVERAVDGFGFEPATALAPGWSGATVLVGPGEAMARFRLRVEPP